ncbi:DUF418 domain-containing protein [Sphingomonas swuensis]|uniref:DUF418 domain-containing protein n=1 Tax=Sphingomonas swuensis TaxID=977800 RepID=A0ABP7T8B8_9SPHN
MMDTNGISRIAEGDRIPSLDILRGLAILLILLMNISWMGGYGGPPLFELRHPSWTPADYWATLILHVTLEGTQRGLLELLFGAGIMIMARRAMTPDGPVEVADLHYRRNLWLILFGLANALLLMWMGDILLVYGIAAIFLFPFRRTGPRGQLGWAALIIAALMTVGAMEYRSAVTERAKVEQLAAQAASGVTLSEADSKKVEEQKARDLRRSSLPAASPDKMKSIEAADQARRSSFGAYWAFQRDGWLMVMSNFFWQIEGEILATMLIGMALYQWGIIQGKASTRTYAALLVVGYAVGLSLRGTLWAERLTFQPGIHWQRMFEDIARLAVTLGHVGLVHLALRASLGRRLLAPFAAAGKMPLSIYLFTSLLMMWVVFAPWGFGLAGRWGMADMTLVAAIVIALELVAAVLWMRRFENGPMEWLWKSLAYQQRQPFRRARLEGRAQPAE